jgi:hypothetical protein
MKNDEPEPMISEPELFRRAFGAKARDPGDLADRVEAEDQQKWDDYAESMEDIGVFGRLGNALALPPAAYLFGLFEPRPTSPQHPSLIGVAFILWALAVLFWTPWIVLRVDRRSPPGDSARAAAILAFGLLGWPLAAAPFVLAIVLGLPDRAPDLMFPVVFGSGLASMLLAARHTPPAAPTTKRSAFLAVGALIYLACTAGFGGLLLGPMLRALRNAGGREQDFIGVVVFLVTLIALMTAFLGLRLARSAFRAWRGRLTAAAP